MGNSSYAACKCTYASCKCTYASCVRRIWRAFRKNTKGQELIADEQIVANVIVAGRTTSGSSQTSPTGGFRGDRAGAVLLLCGSGNIWCGFGYCITPGLLRLLRRRDFNEHSVDEGSKRNVGLRLCLCPNAKHETNDGSGWNGNEPLGER